MNAKEAIITLSVLLGLSVCGNAFLGGLVLAHNPMLGPPPFMAGGPQDDSGPDSMRGGPGRDEHNGFGGRLRAMRDFARDLPPDVRQPIMDAFRNDRDSMIQNVKSMGDARRTVIEALKAEPFDVDKLRSALETQRTLQSGVQQHVHEMLIGVIGKLTPEQRTQLADSAGRLFK